MSPMFAVGDTGGPEVINLQLTFWQLAVRHFRQMKREIRTKCRDENRDAPSVYWDDEFIVESAVCVVLAGTSLSALLGQNVESSGGRTPPWKKLWRSITKKEPPVALSEFFDVYDSIRHFGPGKHAVVTEIDQTQLLRILNAAREAWLAVLQHRGIEPPSFLQLPFRAP